MKIHSKQPKIDMRTIKPKGTLIPIGGSEDKKYKKEILCRVIAETRKRNPKICLITVATSVPDEVAKDYRDAFKPLGLTGLSVINFKTHAEADSAKHKKAITTCDAILMSGGDQLRLSSLLGGTELLSLMKARYYDEPNFVIAGTSAGAAAMSTTMIIAGESEEGMLKGSLQLTNGLNLINSVFIDTHFMQRGRFGRIIQTITCNPGVLGLGLGEDTGVVIRKGEIMEVVGSGLVVVMDRTEITYTDLPDISDKQPITVQGVQMHVIGPGKRFSIKNKSLTNI